ncbi:prevent-host-death protein [Micromonospora sp. PLK6-60]|uniref:prevent-host-death protein n=1 Tax=Micromonospora sp. PLK6-60 TaxID=2873383 RepID=UPI001CA5FB92|nr:prevent-host-death protein [Micromonospora sp. PLK6-60]MBY8872006.1 prevent-host-death protein [Micromonospora sp. PLK6-60]
MHDAHAEFSRVTEQVVPLTRLADRTAVGSLAGQLDLSGDWDSPETNAELAGDFGTGGVAVV